MDFIKNYLNKISDCSVSFTSALTDESLDEMIYKYEDPLKAELLPIVIYASANDSYPKDLKYCLGNMDCYVFIYVISGKLSLKVDDKDFLVSENGFVFLNCNNAFSLISLAESKIYTIYFGGVSVNPYYDAFSTYSSLPICYPDSSSCMLKELLNIRFLPKKLTLSLSFLPAKYIIDIKYIIKTARKVNENISSFTSAICRVLSKYVEKEELSEKCPDCGGKLIREGGCIRCLNCSYSKCL